MYLIRRAGINDKSVLMNLVKSMIGDQNKEEVAKSVVEDFFANSNYLVFILEAANADVGFGVLKLNPFEGANEVGEIVWLGVFSEMKRKGYGRDLVHYIEEYAKKAELRKIYVKTNANNKVAVCFWIMQDYKFEARLLDFGMKSSDDYYLAKEIDKNL